MSIVGPIALYSNVPIQPEFYKPRVYDISAISTGATTTITTSVDNDYVVGQEVRFLIPPAYGMGQLNQQTGFVLSLTSTTQFVVDIDSRQYNPYVASPFDATITNATQANNCVLTANNSYLRGQSVIISDVGGMTELNTNVYQITAVSSTTITLNVNSSSFTAYSGGGEVSIWPYPTQLAQVAAIGTIRSGVTQNSDINSLTTYIPGSFINIS